MMSKQQMDKMREEYEAWFCSTMPYKIAKESWFAVMDDGDYIITDVQAGWAGWKASRAALSDNHSPDAAKMVPDGCAVLMTLDEAIDHANEKSIGSSQCAAQHAQLAKWLTDYKAMLAAAPKHEGGA